MKLQNLQALPPPQSLVSQARLSLSRSLTRLQESSATLYQTSHRKFKPVVAVAAVAASLLIGATGAQATTVVSSQYDQFANIEAIIPGYYTNELTDWLGKGSLTLTNIFDSSSSLSFPSEIEAAVSGKGPTFTILFVSTRWRPNSAVIGWYNPINGVTAVGGNAGETSYDAFLFNLTTNRVLRPEYDPSYPEEFRVSNVNAGSDLYLDEVIRGRAQSYMDTYTDSFLYQGRPQSLLWDPLSPSIQLSNYTNIMVNYLAVYSISVDSLAAASPVPEPASWAMLLLGVGMVGGVARYRRRQAGAATSQYRVA